MKATTLVMVKDKWCWAGVLAGGIVVIVKSARCRCRSRRFAATSYLYRLYRVLGMERVDKGRWGWGDDAARLEAQTGE